MVYPPISFSDINAKLYLQTQKKHPPHSFCQVVQYMFKITADIRFGITQEHKGNHSIEEPQILSMAAYFPLN